MIRQYAAFAILVVSLCGNSWAEDKIELESGRTLEGKIVREEKAWIGIDTGEGVIWVRRKEIKALNRDVPTRGADVPPPAAEPAPADEVESGERVTSRPTPTKGKPAPAQTAAPAEDATQLGAEAERIQRALCSDDKDRRIAAVDFIVATWPKWRAAVKVTLQTAVDEASRVEVVRLLDNAALADTSSLVDLALDDKSAKVRTAALRVARHLKLCGIESRAVELMRSDPTWTVRQEAIRTLEDVGGNMCLPHVMAAWSSETDRDRKRRYRRVMAALLGDDFGDDATGWYRAADELFMGDRVIRKGKKSADDAETH